MGAVAAVGGFIRTTTAAAFVGAFMVEAAAAIPYKHGAVAVFDYLLITSAPSRCHGRVTGLALMLVGIPFTFFAAYGRAF